MEVPRQCNTSLPRTDLTIALPSNHVEIRQRIIPRLPNKLRIYWQALWNSDPTSSSIGGRADDRQRRIALGALAGALAKAVSVGTALFSIPLTLHYLGPERFGMWMTMSSLIAFLSFADMGIGNGLLSSVATAHGRDDRTRIRDLISSAYFILAAIAFAVLTLLAIIYKFVPWHHLFNVQSQLGRAEAGPAIATMITCFALSIPLGIVHRAQLGLQKGYIGSLWQCVGSLIGLSGVLIAVRFEAPLPLLILAYAGAPLLAGLANSVVFFAYSERELAPRIHSVSLTTIRGLIGTGLLFVALQFTASVTYMSDNFIIAQKLGAGAVSEYAVPEKLFALVGMCIALAISPLWPAYGEAIARGDGDWVRRTLRRSLLVSASVAAVGSSVLIITAPWILQLWVGHAVTPPFLLLLGLGVWKVIEAIGASLAMFLNGARIVRFQVQLSLITAGAAISLKLWIVGEVGVWGVVWATIASYTLFTLIPIYKKRANFAYSSS